MAAFSYTNPPFLSDSVLLHNSPPKTPGLIDEFFPYLNQFYPSSSGQYPLLLPNQELSSLDSSAHESSCIQHNVNELSVNEKQRTKSLSMADKAESWVSVDKKRKSRRGSSSSSANSKDFKQAKCKKQKGDEVTIKDVKNDKNDQNKATEEPPKGYIHVRARRGQATDSHSLAERVRREKISERMKLLQSLVPGCEKVTGKALMLDEIINYVQSLQNQVEFLSMKLSSLDHMVHNFGLMDLDAIAFGAEGINNSMGFLMPIMQPNSSSGSSAQPQAFGDSNVITASTSTSTATTTSTTTTTAFPNSPLVDSSATLFQHEQKPSLLPIQEAGGLYWGVDHDQQRQSIINLSANNLYLFH